MDNQATAIAIISIIVGVLLIAVIYAFLYGLVAKFGMNTRLRPLRTYLAALGGLVLGFGFMGLIGIGAYNRGVSGVGYAILMIGGLALLMTAINVLLVRTEEGGQITFIQAFMMQLVPNLLLIAYTIATRPSPY